ncbi:MAG: hypothetical protein CSB48_06695 [Proteobacteria bacterium]|nr:MAG: hypothetical protein CSB48_06695 [Pseudomonadota bacterium]
MFSPQTLIYTNPRAVISLCINAPCTRTQSTLGQYTGLETEQRFTPTDPDRGIIKNQAKNKGEKTKQQDRTDETEQKGPDLT